MALEFLPIAGEIPLASRVLDPETMQFLDALVLEFEPRRQGLLLEREKRHHGLWSGRAKLDFDPATSSIRDGDWTVAPPPEPLRQRHVEITGPVDAKTIINALNSGADVFMADFEDATTPVWSNILQGQHNLSKAIDHELCYQDPSGKRYELAPKLATLFVRPRGWHLDEQHLRFSGVPISGSLFDFGVYFARNCRRLAACGSGAYFYLPKLESAPEAQLWDEVFSFSERYFALPHGFIRATVLVETISAAFAMHEILHALRAHSAGLNAGRWDYIFSMIKSFHSHPEYVMPDRQQVTMTVPFMQYYCELLVATCHRREAHAIGGMAAFIPSRKNPEMNRAALDQVRRDKLREVGIGFDGTWVAHPDLVPVAKEVFAVGLDGAPHQVHKRLQVPMSPRQLLDPYVPDGQRTLAGLRNNVHVTLRYLESWLQGTAAVAIFNLMEDAATAEIARSQIWQWRTHEVQLSDGQTVTAALIAVLQAEEAAKISAELSALGRTNLHLAEAEVLFKHLCLQESFPEFLTLLAYSSLS